MKTQHTPTPCKFIEHSWEEIGIFDADEKRVCSLSIHDLAAFLDEDNQEKYVALNRERAAFIVRACNNHYKLLSAIKNLLDDMYDCDAERKYIDACLEAIAEAEKE